MSALALLSREQVSISDENRKGEGAAGLELRVSGVSGKSSHNHFRTSSFSLNTQCPLTEIIEKGFTLNITLQFDQFLTI